jgi:hypothetical protein
LLAVSLLHAGVLIVVGSLQSGGLVTGKEGSVAFILLGTVVFVVPSAVTGWYLRGRSLNIVHWITLAGLELLFTAAFVGLFFISPPFFKFAAHLLIFAAPVVTGLVLAATFAVTKQRRGMQGTAHYRVRGRVRRFNTSTPSVSMGSAGISTIDSPTVETRVSHGNVPRASLSRGPAPTSDPDAAPDELGVPFLAVLSIALPHALALVAIEALTRQYAWRSHKEFGTMFGLLMAFLFVAPGAAAGWFVRGSSFNLKRWFSLAGTEWLMTAITLLIAVLSGCSSLLANGDWGTAVFFGIPVFAALLLFVALAMTQSRNRY